MEENTMNRYQLIQAVVHDLGDQNKGLQVQGYQNMKIVTAVIEGLNALYEQLHKDEADVRKLIEEKDKQIADLRLRLGDPPESVTAAGEEAAPNDD